MSGPAHLLAELLDEVQRGYLDPLGADWIKTVAFVNRLIEVAVRDAVAQMIQLGAKDLISAAEGVLDAIGHRSGTELGVPLTTALDELRREVARAKVGAT